MTAKTRRDATTQSAAPAALDKAEVLQHHPSRGSYPPISSIPTATLDRLDKAADNGQAPPKVAASDTVLYLAYGSNMCAQTFLGVRKIRPLSQMNVSVPTLRLTFDLPGAPYREPCFANVGFRKVPEKSRESHADKVHQDMDWDGGLIGVVYEVTQQDWRQIMRTEGAGSSYKEIVVPCFPIAEKGTYEDGPKPFFARTLYAALDDDCDRSKGSWWCKLTGRRQRPNPNYAQASARYLKLLQDGGREHDLPLSYQKYLGGLHPYRATHLRQTIGQIVLLACWAPLLIFFLTLTNRFADETGKLPPWLVRIVSGGFNLMWMSYDGIFKKIFGDGERTEGDDKVDVVSDEKASLLEDRD